MRTINWTGNDNQPASILATYRVGVLDAAQQKDEASLRLQPQQGCQLLIPELPELEVVQEVLNRRILGQTIAAAEVIHQGGAIEVRDLAVADAVFQAVRLMTRTPHSYIGFNFFLAQGTADGYAEVAVAHVILAANLDQLHWRQDRPSSRAAATLCQRWRVWSDSGLNRSSKPCARLSVPRMSFKRPDRRPAERTACPWGWSCASVRSAVGRRVWAA